MVKILVVAALLALGVAGQFVLARERPRGGHALAEGAFAALGGFRSLVAEIVWFRADRLQDEGRYVELAQLARALTLSEPHTPEVWSYAAWNLAYNVSVMMPTDEDRWRWVESAMRLLRDDALKYNPNSAELHRELAILFELKLGIDVDSAAATYRRHWRETVEDVARRNAWAEELKMEPLRMAAIEARFGVTDRGDPLYSAIYWACRGIELEDPHATPFLEEIVRQSCMVYARNRQQAQ